MCVCLRVCVRACVEGGGGACGRLGRKRGKQLAGCDAGVHRPWTCVAPLALPSLSAVACLPCQLRPWQGARPQTTASDCRHVAAAVHMCDTCVLTTVCMTTVSMTRVCVCVCVCPQDFLTLPAYEILVATEFGPTWGAPQPAQGARSRM